MGLLHRKPNIRKLAAQLERIEQQLRAIERDDACLPSPIDMKALGWMRIALPRLDDYTRTLDEKLWKRIERWRDTPYTQQKLFRKRIASFFGWWVAGSFTLAYSILGWFSTLFPSPWHMLITSAVITLLILFVLVVRERNFLD